MESKARIKLNKIEALVRAGHGKAATKDLRAFKTKGLSASERAQFANIAARLSLPNLAARLLGNIIRPEGGMKSVATPEEKVEYAGALIRLGGIEEAQTLLKEVGPNEIPNQILFRAFVSISEWDYRGAVPLLEEYIRCPNITHYQRLVAKANLCEALLYVKDRRTAEAFETTLDEAKTHSYTIVHGYLLMNQVNFLISSGDLKNAEVALQTAEEAFRETDTVQGIFVRKWRAIFESHRKGKQGLGQLEKVREEAVERCHWETVRDCDYHKAILTNDKQLMLHLYFGTPYRAYRQNLSVHCPELIEQANEPYTWKIPWGGQRHQVGSSRVDLQACKLEYSIVSPK